MRVGDQMTQDLLAAADRALRESGIEGLSARRISLEAGVSTMNVYSRFGGISGLIDGLVIDGFRQFQSVLGAVAPTGELVSDIVAFASAYRAWVLGQPDRYRLMMTTGIGSYQAGAPVLQARGRLIDAVAERVIVARTERPNSVAPITAEEAAKVVISMLHGMLLLEIDGVVPEFHDSREWALRFASVVRFGISRPTFNAA